MRLPWTLLNAGLNDDQWATPDAEVKTSTILYFYR